MRTYSVRRKLKTRGRWPCTLIPYLNDQRELFRLVQWDDKKIKIKINDFLIRVHHVCDRFVWNRRNFGEKNSSPSNVSVLSATRPKFYSKNTHKYRLRVVPVVALTRLVCVSSTCGDPFVIKLHLGDDPNQLISIFLDHHATPCPIIEIDGVMPPHFFKYY
jgi:hypothetical protein